MSDTDSLSGFGAALAHSYESLPARFFARVEPTPVAEPHLVRFNRPLAEELGLDLGFDAQTLAAIFSGNRSVPGAVPISMAYAGHQFGQFVPQLGDGRAILIGEVRDRSGRLRDIQLKGAGLTPFSRSADGRAALGPVLREYLVSEAMHALGVPATRALAAVTTGERVFRERPLPGAILTRVASSHVRVGTFQYFAARGDGDAVRRLADYVIDRLYPDIAAAANPYLELLRSVIERQASLVAAWLNVGFIHGVMNTDNMAVSGETIDFGPCAFMDDYDPAAVFSSIDSAGRYAYKNQPVAAQWNLARFAETLLPLLDPASERAIQMATEAVTGFAGAFDGYWLAGMRRKLGLFTAEEGDGLLVRQLLDVLQSTGADFTNGFRRLCVDSDFYFGEAGASDAAALDWTRAWHARRQREPQSASERAASMRLANPAFIPRNHLIEQVITAAVEHADYAPFETLHAVLARPYDEQPEFAAYASPARPDERVMQTFCGT
jgi:uncharacterized protein YdiU (UPF0061 family)